MSWKSGSKYVICCVIGGLILFVCRRLNWSRLQEVSIKVFGVFLISIGCV